MQAELLDLRTLQLVLPTEDVQGNPLVGVELVRVLYLPLGLTKPTPGELTARGEVVLERRRPDLPGPGATVTLDLRPLRRSQGWITVVAVRLGNVAGRPSQVLPWVDPAL